MRGLAYLHETKVVHRDIKLENLVFGREDDFESLKIIDFGIAALLEEGTLTSACGTPGYLAPELFDLSQASFDSDDEFQGYAFPVDVFSAGVVFYRLYVY